MSIRFIGADPKGTLVTNTLQVMKFPGGEVHLKAPADYNETAIAAYVTGAHFDDYLALGMWADFVHSTGQQAIAFIPYLPAARADRGAPFGARVYADLINSFGLDHVACFDPHSAVAPALYDNLTVMDHAPVVRDAIAQDTSQSADYVGVIAPDKGAHDRANAVARLLNVPTFTAAKVRNPDTGALSDFTCEPLPDTGRLLVVDDICDGGGTFRGLAASTGLDRTRLGLWVSHGIFSGQADRLGEHFGAVYTTDSHPGADRAEVAARITPLLPLFLAHRNAQKGA